MHLFDTRNYAKGREDPGEKGGNSLVVRFLCVFVTTPRVEVPGSFEKLKICVSFPFFSVHLGFSGLSGVCFLYEVIDHLVLIGKGLLLEG